MTEETFKLVGKRVLPRMEKNGALGPEDIPIEIRVLIGKINIDWITKSFNKISSTRRISINEK